jgi:hypothetical protein
MDIPLHPLHGNTGSKTCSGSHIKVTHKGAQESHEQQAKKCVLWFSNMCEEMKISRKDEIYKIFAHHNYEVQDQASL